MIGKPRFFGAAQEAALKLKETCGLHAEAFSAAEVKHGPMAIVGEGFPVLLFAQQDKTLAGMDSLVQDFRARNPEELVQIYAELDRLEPIEQDDEVFRPVSALFHWPLAIALILSFLLALGRVGVASLAAPRRDVA
mgnify:CR=1 FL=1